VIVRFVCFLLIASILFSSCATILSGGKTKIRVYDGMPPNAQVYVDGNYVGTAPCKFKVHKTMNNAQHKIDIKATGYETQTVTTNRKFSAGFFILDIFTGVIWTVIDFATGNLYKQRPKKIHYNLMPIGNTSMVQTESATVNTNVNVVKPVEKTAEPTKQTKVVAPAVTYKPDDEVYCSSFFSFGKCQPVSVKAVKTDGTCIVANSDGKELKKTPKYIYPKGGESSAFKLGNSVRFGNKIFGVKTGKVVSVPNAEKCIVETSKGDFVLKKQSALMKE
ncbi:MAG: PEGA domain-containing protein, partial [Bacteroidales bacterium]|nr:PEGA domain-containing protein [Bacteroidales bacterium]